MLRKWGTARPELKDCKYPIPHITFPSHGGDIDCSSLNFVCCELCIEIDVLSYVFVICSVLLPILCQLQFTFAAGSGWEGTKKLHAERKYLCERSPDLCPLFLCNGIFIVKVYLVFHFTVNFATF